MQYEAIRLSTDRLSRQVWTFSLNIGWTSKGYIYFDCYQVQSKKTPRHKWHTDASWIRTMLRDCTIKFPPLPNDVLMEVRKYYSEQILTLEVKQ